ISATRSIPSPASTKTRGRVISSSRRTVAGSRPAATTFARMSHSVTIPMGRPSGDATMTNPWRRSAIDFAAPRRVVSGRIERNSGSRMSFANRTIGGDTASAAFMPLLAGNRLHAGPARDGRRDGPDQADRREDHRHDQDRVRNPIRKRREPDVGRGGDEETARREPAGAVLVREVAAEGTDAHEGQGERDQQEPRVQRVEAERALEVEDEDE